ncbi:MAG: hypothetical protein HYV04_10985 [Deltaproteobacteria bacterium]|nr:hypothetical protein [Deltaproteobacteria bacterium]
MRKLKQLIGQASAAPFYQRKLAMISAGASSSLKAFTQKAPTTTLEELIAEKRATGDPYSSRWNKDRAPLVVFQLEYDSETSLYIGLGREELAGYAEALRRCWSLLGLRRGDGVGIFDYGTSPVSYLASSAFTPYLRRGAADALGCVVICNDGGANMSRRAVEIIKYVRPRILFLRSDCLHPFALEVEKESISLSDYTGALVAVENEAVLSTADREAYEKRLAVRIYRMLRIDAAMFLAVECPRCRLLHTWQDLFLVESPAQDNNEGANPGPTPLVITNWFAKSCPAIRYVSQVKATLEPAGCPRGPKDVRIAA